MASKKNRTLPCRWGSSSTVAARASAAAAGDSPTAPLPRYPLRSNSQSSLLLQSPLRTPRRQRRINIAYQVDAILGVPTIALTGLPSHAESKCILCKFHSPHCIICCRTHHTSKDISSASIKDRKHHKYQLTMLILCLPVVSRS